MKRHPEWPRPMSIRERFAWIVIYLNLPLIVTVGILGFVFGQWGMVKILLGVNIVLLLTSYILFRWKPTSINGMTDGEG